MGLVKTSREKHESQKEPQQLCAPTDVNASNLTDTLALVNTRCMHNPNRLHQLGNNAPTPASELKSTLHEAAPHVSAVNCVWWSQEIYLTHVVVPHHGHHGVHPTHALGRHHAVITPSCVLLNLCDTIML